jgi:hypothetical protein
MNPNQQIEWTENRSQVQELPRPRWHFTETYSQSLQECMDETVAQAECGLVRGIWNFGRFW